MCIDIDNMSLNELEDLRQKIDKRHNKLMSCIPTSSLEELYKLHLELCANEPFVTQVVTVPIDISYAVIHGTVYGKYGNKIEKCMHYRAPNFDNVDMTEELKLKESVEKKLEEYEQKILALAKEYDMTYKDVSRAMFRVCGK